MIGSISCSPSSPTTDDSVTCTATLSGGTPDSYAWSGGASSGSSASYSTSFGTSGSKTVSLTVRNTGGSDSSSTTVTVSEAVQAPVIDSISCSPSSPNVNESVTCTASLSGGTPEDRYGYAWSGPIGTSAGFSASYSTSFGTSGSKTISLTVTNTAGSDSSSTKVTVQAPAEAPVIDSISCSPSSLNVGDDVTCTATLSGGTPSSYAWIGGDSSTSSASYSTSFGTAGSKTVSLTVRNEAGSDSGSTTVTVQTPVAAPVIDSVSCSPSSPSVGDSVTCTATLSGGTPDSYAWSGGDSSGSSASYSTSFSTSGSKTVSLTVTNTAGSATETLLLTVAASSNRAPVWGGADDYEPIDWLVVGSTHGGCLSDGLFTDPDGDRLTLTASSTAPAIASVSVTDDTRGPCYGVQALTVGLAYIDMTVTDSHGASASRRVRVQVRPPRPQFSISCTPSAPTVDQEVTCSVVVSSGGDHRLRVERRQLDGRQSQDRHDAFDLRDQIYLRGPALGGGGRDHRRRVAHPDHAAADGHGRPGAGDPPDHLFAVVAECGRERDLPCEPARRRRRGGQLRLERRRVQRLQRELHHDLQHRGQQDDLGDRDQHGGQRQQLDDRDGVGVTVTDFARRIRNTQAAC